jgi:predicted nucleotidyltransferase
VERVLRPVMWTFFVDLHAGCALMDLGGLLMDLQEALHVRVEVATEQILRPKFREQDTKH